MTEQKTTTQQPTSPSSTQNRPAGPGNRPAGGGAPRPAGAGGFRPAGARPAGPRPSSPRPAASGQRPAHSGPRMNDMINVRSVFLIDEAGTKVGVVDTREAQRRATEAGLDLVEIVPNAEPPVCKIMDYGRHKYQEQKKAAEARKKQKVIEIKEIKLRPNIDEHDYDVKMKAARGFFEEGHKVKFTLRFRGREVSHAEIGMRLLERVRTELQEMAKVEQHPRVEGKQAVLVMAAVQK